MTVRDTVAVGNVGLTPILAVNDTDLPATALNGQVLAFNGATGKWEATTMAAYPTFISEYRKTQDTGTDAVALPATAKHFALLAKFNGVSVFNDMEVTLGNLGAGEPAAEWSPDGMAFGALLDIPSQTPLGRAVDFLGLKNGAAGPGAGNTIDFTVRFYT